jgi:hypothetical protein
VEAYTGKSLQCAHSEALAQWPDTERRDLSQVFLVIIFWLFRILHGDPSGPRLLWLRRANRLLRTSSHTLPRLRIIDVTPAS